MIGKPIRLDWNSLMADDGAASPLPELVVVATAPPGRASSCGIDESMSLSERVLTYSQLEQKIQRMTKDLKELGTKLPDKGLKLQESLRRCQEELESRNVSGIQKGFEHCGVDNQPQAKVSCEASNSIEATVTSKCDSQSFSSLFNQKLDEKAESMSKSKSSSGNQCAAHKGRQPAIISSRELPFALDSLLSSTKKQPLSTDSRFVETSRFYAPCSGRRHSKRLKADGRSKKVQDVVFLDEEDAQFKETAIDTSDDWGKAKLYYPSRDDPESVELSYCDIKCLEPQQYLSSPIMNFYILYLQRPLSSINKLRGEYYFFNTYFYGKLEEALLKKGDRFSRFQKLRRWWKGVNIFEKAYIFVPIHRDLHWSLAIVSFPPQEDDSCPIILHLDSLGLHNSKQILDVIHCYLTEECKFMKIASSNIPISDKIWDEVPLKIDKKEIKVPQQKNEYDCGIFVLYFMERFIEGAPERLKRKDLSMFGSQWFQPEDASALRKRIKDLLLKEFESARLEFGGKECRESPSSSSDSVD